MPRSARLFALAALAAGLAACGDNTTSSSSTAASTAVTTTTAAGGSTTNVGNRIDEATKALQRGDFSTMLQILSLTTLGNEIADRAVTILSPTNAAFNAMSGDEMRNLLGNPTKIDDVLRRHILDGAFTLDQLKGMTSVKTIGGDTLSITPSGDTVMIEGATLSQVDMSNTTTSQGQDLVIYSIDKVLLPS